MQKRLLIKFLFIEIVIFIFSLICYKKFFINAQVGLFSSAIIYFLSARVYLKAINEDMSKFKLYLIFFSPTKLIGYIIMLINLILLLKFGYFSVFGFVFGIFLMICGVVFNDLF